MAGRRVLGTGSIRTWYLQIQGTFSTCVCYAVHVLFDHWLLVLHVLRSLVCCRCPKGSWALTAQCHSWSLPRVMACKWTLTTGQRPLFCSAIYLYNYRNWKSLAKRCCNQMFQYLTVISIQTLSSAYLTATYCATVEDQPQLHNT